MTRFEVRLLGPVEVASGRDVVRPSAAKVRAVLAMLALSPNRPLNGASIADRLWSGSPPATAASVVRTYVSQVRTLLPDGDDRLRRDGDGYVLRLAEDELDVLRFERLLDAASAPGVSKGQELGLLKEALDLWRGDPLLDLADDPAAEAEAARLGELRWGAVEQAADADLTLGRHESAVARLEAAVREAPLREQLVSRLMLALYRSGRQADALAAYQRLRRSLVDDLGLDPSEELRRLEAAVLAQDPSLDPPSLVAGNLPTPSTSFVGREADLECLDELLRRERLVTLTGPGGSGKTRLAVEVARRRQPLTDGTWVVELSGRRRSVEVVRAALAVLGLTERTGDGVEAVGDVLAERQALVVLDNCEHLLDACAALATAVVRRCPRVTILATSRMPLSVPGEVVWEVAPLATPTDDQASHDAALAPAAQLLSDRVAAARGGVSPRDDEWRAVVRLCQELDGLPLGIELVAARSRTLGLDELATAVARQAVELAGRPGGPDHHRSLSSCVRWSLDLLDDEARHLLQRVSLLPGWFSPEAAGAVAGVAEPMLGLADLAGQSLLQAAPGHRSRFRLLETVRQVVLRTISEDEANAALDALAAWAAEWAESVEPKLRGADAARLLDEFEAELPVLHAVLDHGLAAADPTAAIRLAAAMSAVWAYRGHLLEGREMLDRAVAASETVATPLRLRVLLAAGTHRVTFGDVDGFRRHVDAALMLARTSGGEEVLRPLLWAGHAVHLHGEHETAGALYGEALALARAAGDRSSAASALAGLGDVATARGDLDAAADRTLEALAEFRAVGDRHGEGQALLNLGEVDRLAGRFDTAVTALTSATDVFSAIGDRSCVAAAGEARARLAFDTGRFDGAEELYRAAAAIRRQLHQHHRVVGDLQALAAVLVERGRPVEAAAVLGAAGDDTHPLADRLRRELGHRAYLEAWAEGSVSASSGAS